MREPWLQDADVTLYHGDVLEVLSELPPESVDCVVTSPPYWGLRDYGTPGQLGLEPTPEQYVERMVEVFREVRRVLVAYGTVWLNLGDSYNNRNVSRKSSHQGGLGFESDDLSKSWATLTQEGRTRLSIENGDMKEKDLCGIPWMVAFALRADDWYLRSDIVWSKPNPMPESVTDRPTKAHEYVFLLSKQPRYFFDQEAVREKYDDPERMATRREVSGPGTYVYTDGERSAGPARGPDGRRVTKVVGSDGSIQHRDGERWPNGGRNIRSVWEIATQPYPEAHFATFPEELARRCISAGTPEFVCTVCNTPMVSGRQQNLTEPEAVQEDVRRVRDSLRGSESEVLLSELLNEGSRQESSAEADVSELRDDLLGQGQEVLLAEVLVAVDGEDRREPAAMAGGQARGQLEGRKVREGWIRPSVREGAGLHLGASPSDGGQARQAPAQDGVRPSPQWDQERQPDRELGTDDEESASGNGGVSSLRRDVRDSLSPCCNAPLRPGRVCDPFMGSGTVAFVARKLGRHAIGIDLSADYLDLAARRLQQQSLFAVEHG